MVRAGRGGSWSFVADIDHGPGPAPCATAECRPLHPASNACNRPQWTVQATVGGKRRWGRAWPSQMHVAEVRVRDLPPQALRAALGLPVDGRVDRPWLLVLRGATWEELRRATPGLLLPLLNRRTAL